MCPAVIATALADKEHEQHTLPASLVTQISSEALKAQEGDLISKILQYLKTNQWPKVKNSDETTKAFLRERSKLYQDENGVLYRKTVTRSQLVLPKSFHKLVLQQLHQEMGHLGVERTLHLIRERFYWPHMQRDVEQHITKKCYCVKRGPTSLHKRAPLTNIVSTYPLEIVSIDFLQLERCMGGYE